MNMSLLGVTARLFLTVGAALLLTAATSAAPRPATASVSMAVSAAGSMDAAVRPPVPRGARTAPPAWKPAAVPAWRGSSPFRVSPRAVPVPDRQAPQQQRWAGEVIKLVNAERSRVRCPALSAHPLVREAAQRHSADMARTARLTHRSSNGSTPASRLTAVGYRFSRTGEVVTAGPRDAAGAMDSWMGSPAHRRVLLTCSFRHAGTGLARNEKGSWWTLLLATPS
ncbi:CAP domain-containing protein [Streptomyces sp. NPDC054865]